MGYGNRMARLVSKEQYFDQGLDVLAQAGFAGLNIGVLCRALGVTSGSFYHHFGSWQGFVDALLAYWEGQQARRLRELEFGSGTPESDVDKLRELTLGLHHRAEAAIRAWGANDASVGTVLRQVDDARRRILGKAIAGVVGDRAAAAHLTSLGMAMLVGYQQLSAAGHRDDFAPLLDEFVRLVFSHAHVVA